MTLPPLANRTVLLTRSAQQAEAAAQLVREWGGRPLLWPTIEIQPLEDYQVVDQHLTAIQTVDWLVFTSSNGVTYTQQRCQRLGVDLTVWLGQIAVIGPGTAQTLQDGWHRAADLVASQHLAEVLAIELSQTGIQGKHILCLRATQARPELIALLQQAGANVSDLAVYRTVLPENPVLFTEPTVNYITFASASAVRHFAERVFQDTGYPWLHTAKIAVIGPITAQAAQAYLGRVDIMAEVHTFEGLLAAIAADVAA